MNEGELKDVAHAVVAAICTIAGPKASLHAPEVAGNEWAYVKECLDTEWVSSVGAYVDNLESMIAGYTGALHAIATMNGTAALHVALLAAGVQPGDEVIAPTLTFVATANAISYCQAIPHFADACPRTLGLDPVRLRQYLREIAVKRNGNLINKETGRVIRAVVCMHTFGHPVELDRLVQVCQEFDLVLVEDAAESLGSYYKGRHTGNHGLLSSLSFNGNKIVTTGGGGAVLTNDSDLAKRVKHLTTTAKTPHPWEFNHDAVGFNYRMPNVNAAIGCAQLERLPNMLERKRLLADRYAAAFQAVPNVDFFKEPDECKSNYWLNCILVENRQQRDAVLELAGKQQIQCRPAWSLMHTLPMYKECPRMTTPVSESIFDRLINIPSSPRLVGSSI